MEVSQGTFQQRHQAHISSPYLAEDMAGKRFDADYQSFDGVEAEPKTILEFLGVRGGNRKDTFVLACFISLAAIAGTFFRIIIAQLFGEECKNPGSVGWLRASAPLCVTTDGQAVQEGGIIFADIPSNILGSFIMGLFQDSSVLVLAVPMAVAWLGPNHPFQKMNVLHIAIKTGFCGSLTTFSSWNSEMVVMIFGTAFNRQTQLVSAILGYIIGMETALGSFACGKSFARYLHRVSHPVLAAEADAMQRRKAEGIHLNQYLPDFERRFLPDLLLGEHAIDMYPIGQIDAIERWRSSTKEARRVGHRYLQTLIDIEMAMLVTGEPIHDSAKSIAEWEAWDLPSLHQWVQSKAKNIVYLPSLGSMSIENDTSNEEVIWFSVPVSALLISFVLLLLSAALFAFQGEDAQTIVLRTMVYSMLFAPLGAMLRWQLASLNKTCTYQGWEWLPLGTFYANIFGSLVSIATIAVEYHLESSYPYNVTSFWRIGTLRAVRNGFAGCLTTVSTFVAEVSGFMQTNTDHAYPYILLSCGISCGLACLVYGVIVYAI